MELNDGIKQRASALMSKCECVGASYRVPYLALVGPVCGSVGQALVPRHWVGAVLRAPPVGRLQHLFTEVVASLERRGGAGANSGEGQNGGLGENVGKHCISVFIQEMPF